MKKFVTVKECFEYLGLDYTTLPDVSTFPADLQEYMLNHFIYLHVVKALNKQANDGKEWEPDWSNWSECKYFPWTEVQTTKDNKAGVGFSDSDFVCSGAVALVGSRLCFLNRELAMHVQEVEEFKMLLIVNQLIIK